MKRIIYPAWVPAILVFCLYAPFLPAQDQHDYTWLMGSNNNNPAGFFGANFIHFNHGVPTVQFFVSPMDLWVPCIMSDEQGELLFYTNGCKILNKQHTLMENGDNINSGSVHDNYCNPPGAIGYPAVHSLMALPFPGHDQQYFLFHTRDYGDTYNYDFLFSRIDMNENGGLGKVLEKNIGLLHDTLGLSISAVKHANGRDWWIVTGEQENDNLYCFLLDTGGVHSIPIVHNSVWAGEYPGMICFSPDGRKMVRSGHGTPAVFRIYDFDRCTGEISNPVDLGIPDDEAYVSWACFSPNSRYLYITNLVSRLYQYDTWASDIGASVQLIGEYDGFVADYNVPTTMFTMTLGPDQRIYMSANNGVRYLHTIHRPDEPGPACDFRQHDFTLPALFPFFLPNMPNYRLYNEPGSPCDTLGIQPPIVAQWYSEPDSAAGPTTLTFTDISYFQPTYWHWSFGDGDTSLLQSPLHAYPSPGEYDVCLITCNEAGQCDTMCRTIQVTLLSETGSPKPESDLKIAVWPNPANQHLWVAHGLMPAAWFVISDLSGMEILRLPFQPGEGIESINLGKLSVGLYFWQITTGEQTQSGKFVIQK